LNDYKYLSILKNEMNDYLELRKSQGFKTQVTHIAASLDKYLVSQKVTEKTLSAKVVDGWLAYECNIKKSSNVNKYIGFYKSLAKYLHLIGIDVFVPEYFRANNSYVPYIFTEQEITVLFNAVDNIEKKSKETSKVHFALLLRILYGCGLRLGEALALRKSDVDCNNGTLFIRNAKNSKDRLVPMHSSLNEIVQRYLEGFMGNKPPDAHLFESDHNKKTFENQARSKQWAEEGFDQLLKIIEIEKVSTNDGERGVCLHCLRHTFTVHSIRQQELAGIDNYDAAPSISIYLGHCNMNGTQKYLHMTAEISKDIIDTTNAYSTEMFPSVPIENCSVVPIESAISKITPPIQEILKNEYSAGIFPKVPL